MIVPTLATIVVGTNGLIGHIDTASNADRARVLANLSLLSGDLVHDLQDERAGAVMLLGSAGDEQTSQRAAVYAEAQQRVDDSEQDYQDLRTSLTDVPAGFRSLLNDIGGRLSGLPQLRSRIAAGEFGLTDAAASYEELISNLISIRDSAAQLSGETALGDRMRAAAGIARSKEFLSRQRVVGHEVLIRGAYHPHLRTAFIGTQTGRQQAEEQFNSVATTTERTMLEQMLDGPEVRQSVLFQDYLDSLQGEELGTPPWDADGWDAALSAHAGLLREMEQHLDEVVVSEATALRDAVTQQVLVETGALLGMLLLAIMLAWLVARSMARSLRELRQGALSVAQYGLPQAVARLRDPSLSTQLSPSQVAGQIAEPLPVRSRDEFGQVTEAFNAVHLEAVRTAAEQAALRSSVATMFVNLARRSQILVDRLIGHLDRLERGEEDPDRLAELFQLDHLATRMRRNDENLLVLAGADSTRVQREPAALIDVLRAAQSEVEHYTRIEFGVIDRDIEVSAHAVNDLVHLVAELLDNATAFSPPDSHVTVEARRVGDRAVLYVEDQGLGLSADQLAEINERLATPPLVDVAVSRMMGLVVVARLAVRHGVKVELRRASARGTIADVTLPPQVLVPRALVGRLPGLEPPRGRPANEVSPRSPLALESGPSTQPIGPVSAPLRFEPPSFGTPPPVASPTGPFRTDDPASSVRPTGRLPAWSDLTGAAGHNGAEQPASTAPGGPLPQRRPGGGQAGDGRDGYTGDGPVDNRAAAGGAADGPAGDGHAGDGGPLIPRQRPSGELPDGAGYDGRDGAGYDGRDGAGDDSTGGRQVPQPAAPPTWPPIAPPATPPAPPAAGPDEPDHAPATEQASGYASQPRPEPPVGAEPYAPPPRAPKQYADETMELPIFTQLESAWFRTRRPTGSPTGPAGSDLDTGDTSEFVSVGATGTTTGDLAMGQPARGTVPDGQSPVMAGGDLNGEAGWLTAADEGWRAAASLTEPEVEETTESGLPKRRPMAQLVPGGVDATQAVPQRRSPEAVRGLLSAYHRGVQRGRMQTTDDASHPTQAGKEQGA
jgi:signal transduction histidine kinase